MGRNQNITHRPFLQLWTQPWAGQCRLAQGGRSKPAGVNTTGREHKRWRPGQGALSWKGNSQGPRRVLPFGDVVSALLLGWRMSRKDAILAPVTTDMMPLAHVTPKMPRTQRQECKSCQPRDPGAGPTPNRKRLRSYPRSARISFYCACATACRDDVITTADGETWSVNKSLGLRWPPYPEAGCTGPWIRVCTLQNSNSAGHGEYSHSPSALCGTFSYFPSACIHTCV